MRGIALGIIDSLPTTEDRYAVAYELLERRYNNPKLLIQKHTRELFRLQSLETKSAEALRKLLNNARKHLRCLQILKQPVESWNAVLIHLMSNKLDPLTRREWETTTPGTAPPLYDQLENFVATRCQMLDAIPRKRKALEETSGYVKRYKPEVKVLTINNQNKQRGCAACNRDHFIGTCSLYGSKSIEQKLQIIRRSQLCFNCLKPNHTSENCRNSGCTKCGRKHHTTIHREKERVHRE